MNIDTRSSRPELGQAVAANRAVSEYDGSKDKLLADLKTVVVDAETLMKEAAGASIERFAALRARCEATLGETRAKIDRARVVVGEKTKYAADATHTYVKENPWKSAGVVAAAGVVVGILLRRR